tara:strand:+ start:817 stop:1533 length:717 start_codon:yes stop_codon:yes gene_type:complete
MRTVILVAIFSGGLAGAVTQLFVPAPKNIEPQTADVSAKAEVKPQDLSGLIRRLKAMEQRLSRVEDASEPATATRKDASGSPSEHTAKRTQDVGDMEQLQTKAQRAVDKALETLNSEESPLREAVSGIVQDEMKNRMEEWRAFRTARGEARDEERLDQLEKAVGLEPQQRIQLLDLLKTERSDRRALRREARDTMDFRAMGQKRRDLRARTDAAASEVLSPEQHEAWQQSRIDRRRRR